jgi:hypothetical protein
VDQPGALGAEAGERLGHRAQPAGVEGAGHLALHPARVRQRAEQVEDGARAELDPGAAGVAQRRMVARRHQEQDAASAITGAGAPAAGPG